MPEYVEPPESGQCFKLAFSYGFSREQEGTRVFYLSERVWDPIVNPAPRPVRLQGGVSEYVSTSIALFHLNTPTEIVKDEIAAVAYCVIWLE